ncbi:hypothetical protein D3C76_1401470 [compost metagenome]
MWLPKLRQHTGQLYPLLLAAGKLAIIALGQFKAVGLRHHLLHRMPCIAFAVRCPSHADHFLHGKRKGQITVLAHHRAYLRQLLRLPLF